MQCIVLVYAKSGNFLIKQYLGKEMQTWQLNEMCPERLELVLQEKKIVRGCNCDNVFRWVPCGVQDLFVEIQAVDKYLVLFAFTACANLKKQTKKIL